MYCIFCLVLLVMALGLGLIIGQILISVFSIAISSTFFHILLRFIQSDSTHPFQPVTRETVTRANRMFNRTEVGLVSGMSVSIGLTIFKPKPTETDHCPGLFVSLCGCLVFS